MRPPTPLLTYRGSTSSSLTLFSKGSRPLDGAPRPRDGLLHLRSDFSGGADGVLDLEERILVAAILDPIGIGRIRARRDTSVIMLPGCSGATRRPWLIAVKSRSALTLPSGTSLCSLESQQRTAPLDPPTPRLRSRGRAAACLRLGRGRCWRRCTCRQRCASCSSRAISTSAT